MDNWNGINFNDLKGKTLKNVTGLCKDSEEAVFECTDGTKYRMNHYQDCCESVYIEDVCGDVEDLLNSKILVAEEVKGANIPPKKEYDESYTWTFYKLATVEGTVVIRWYGVSNGYYSESVSFEKCGIPIDSTRTKSTTPARDRFRFRVWDKLHSIYHYDAEDTCDYVYGSPVIPVRQFSCLIDDDNYVLEQCTGLKDKKGTLIYEGDIVRTEDKGDGTITGAITFISDRGRCGFYLRTDFGLVVDIALSVYEVLGNVHENPELLEGKDTMEDN